MALTYYVRNAAGTLEDITSHVRLYTLDVTSNAEEVSVGSSQIVLDDPDGNLDIGGHRQFRITEDAVASASNQVLYVGYTAERVVSRGPYRNGVGRIWTVTLVDLNSVLERKVNRGSSANRPAETAGARAFWAADKGSLINDFTYLSYADPVPMDAVDYRGQRDADVIHDAMEASGKNAFVWFNETANDWSLFYDRATSSAYRSPIRLSNDLDDIDEVWTFAISPDTTLSRDPSRVYSGVYLPYDGGVVYEEEAATEDAFALGGRDAVMPSLNVKSQAKATARAIRYLGDLGTEEDVITTSTTLPAAKVNLLMQGMGVQVKGTHLEGYSAFNWGRVLNRNVVQVSEEFYTVRMDIVMTGPSVNDGGDQSQLPPSEPSNLLGTLQADIECGSKGGSSEAIYGDDGTGPGTLYIYNTATYRFDITVSHGHCAAALYSHYIKVNVEGTTLGTQNFGSQMLNNAISFMTLTGTKNSAAAGLGKIKATLNHTAYSNANGGSSTVACSVYYVSGTDPRFA